ncbi:MAG: hypothetical protein Q4C96_07595 [Planctomycetia bacterium]|nr:hypothetical protein [Planctomycetia bacterium]
MGIIFFVLILFSPCYAEVLPQEDSGQGVQEVGECLQKNIYRSYPWYNLHKDSLQPVPIYEARDVKDVSSEKDNIGKFFAYALQIFMYFMLVVVAGIFLFAIFYWVKNMLGNMRSGKTSIMEKEEVKRRTEALPEEIQTENGDYARLAEEAYARGDYRLAIIYLFAFQLLKLDEYHRIHLLKGRTNRQYQKALRHSLKKQFTDHREAISVNASEEARLQLEKYRQLGSKLEHIFSETMILFEEIFYGNHVPKQDKVEWCFIHLNHFQEILRVLENRVKKEFSPWQVIPSARPQTPPGKMENHNLDFQNKTSDQALSAPEVEVSCSETSFPQSSSICSDEERLAESMNLSLAGHSQPDTPSEQDNLCEKDGFSQQKINIISQDGFSCWWIFLFAGVIFLTGCQKKLNTDYGMRTSFSGNDSIVGTNIFSDVLKGQGHRVESTWRLENQKFRHVDCIVWFILDCNDMSDEAYLWMEEWLKSGTPEKPRKLLTIHRGFDGEKIYYDYVLPDLEGRQLDLMKENAQKCLSGTNHRCDKRRWVYHQEFSSIDQYPVTRLQGHSDWIKNINVEKSSLWNMGQMCLRQGTEEITSVPFNEDVDVMLNYQPEVSVKENPGEKENVSEEEEILTEGNMSENNDSSILFKSSEILLSTQEINGLSEKEIQENCTCLLSDQENRPLLLKREFKNEGGEMIGTWLAAANGSFLLNAQMVNHENRKLAYRLAREMGQGKKRTIFLETYSDPMIIENAMTSDNNLEGWEMFKVFPLNFILLHITLMTIFYMFYKFPIFGRPRRIFVARGSRFSEHLRAVGRLLKRK